MEKNRGNMRVVVGSVANKSVMTKIWERCHSKLQLSPGSMFKEEIKKSKRKIISTDL